MRIWMLASLLYAVVAIGGDRGMKSSSRFLRFAGARSLHRLRRDHHQTRATTMMPITINSLNPKPTQIPPSIDDDTACVAGH